MFGYNINNPLRIGSHVKYFKKEDLDKLINMFPQMKEGHRFYNSFFRVGFYDDKFPVLKFLSKVSPNLFGGLVGVLLKKQ